MPIRIVLADHHGSYRRVIHELFDAVPDFLVVGEAQDGQDAVLLAALARPDVVIIEVAMPRVDGMEACRRILAARTGVRVLALTLHNESCYLEAMGEAGALGYVLKQDAFTDLVAAVRAVADGQRYLSLGLSLARSRDEPTMRT